MIYKLKTQQGKVLATVEVGLEQLRKEPNVEIRSVVNIKTYSELMQNVESTKEMHILIKTVSTISSLRDWMWDDYFAMKRNVGSELEGVVKNVKNVLLTATIDLNLKLE